MLSHRFGFVHHCNVLLDAYVLFTTYSTDFWLLLLCIGRRIRPLMTRKISGTKLWLYCFVLWLGIEHLNLLFSTLAILLVSQATLKYLQAVRLNDTVYAVYVEFRLVYDIIKTAEALKRNWFQWSHVGTLIKTEIKINYRKKAKLKIYFILIH